MMQKESGNRWTPSLCSPALPFGGTLPGRRYKVSCAIKKIFRTLLSGCIFSTCLTAALFASDSADPAFYLDDRIELLPEGRPEEDLLDPSSLPTFSLHYQSGNYRLAILELLRLDSMNVPDGNRDVVLLMLAESFRKLDLWPNAQRYYGEVLDQFSESPLRVFALYRLQDGAYRQREYARCDSLGLLFESQYRRHKLYSASLYLWAKSLVRESRYREAVAVLSRIPREGDFHLAGNFLHGLCEAALGNKTKALVFFDYVASLAGASPLGDEARIVEGDLYFQLGQYETALSMYRRVSEPGKKKDYLWLRMANAYFSKGNYRQAIPPAEQILRECPESLYLLEAGLLLERAYRAVGDTANARRITSVADLYARQFRILFIATEELQRLQLLEAAWNQSVMQSHPLSRAEASAWKKLAQGENAKIHSVQKEIRRLSDRIDPAGGLRSQIGNTLLAEQQYLEVLHREIARMVQDSTDLFSDCQSARQLLDTLSDSLKKSLREKEARDLESAYRATCRELAAFEKARQEVLSAFSGLDASSKTGGNLPAKFVDWGMIRLQDLKDEIQRESRWIKQKKDKIRQWEEAMKAGQAGPNKR